MRVLRRWPAVVALLVVLVPASGAAALDRRVERSRDELRRTQAQAADTAARLDRAAAAYEEARAHLEGLNDEERRTELEVANAQRHATRVDAEVRDRLVTLFKHPELRLRALTQIVVASSVGETLHQLELIDQLASSGAQQLEHADRVTGRVRAAEHDYRVVTAGVRGAVRERRERASALGESLARARADVEAAGRRLRTVQATVEAERRRRRLERQRTRLLRSGGGGPLPPIDGKVCPVGSPNAFSDSWGAPRSGGRSHQGVDMFAAHGTPLYAIEAGTIRTSDNSLGGVSVHLAAVSGDAYYYAHLSERTVVTGQRVRAGDVVGAVGNTGNARSTPPHLHFQYHPGGGTPVNPTPLVTVLCRS